MNKKNTRRNFIKTASLLSAGLVGLKSYAYQSGNTMTNNLYGELISDANKILKLPKGFSYQIISKTGQRMSDGLLTPGKPDGMATFRCDEDRTIIVRNHEISYRDQASSAYGRNNELLGVNLKQYLYDYGKGALPALGGCTTVVYNHKKKKIEKDYMSLMGTVRNCAGGPTPWNSWLSCEEDVSVPFNNIEKRHGYVFEVPVSEDIKRADPKPIKEMGRFNHEAVAVDPNSGIVYLTEDRSDGLVYRYIPKVKEKLAKGGTLQALRIKNDLSADTRNWNLFGKSSYKVGEEHEVEWVTIKDYDNQEDDIRFIGFNELKAARFARGEGMWYGNDAVYFACTNGGKARTGQIWKYTPGENEGKDNESFSPGKLSLFAEPNNRNIVNNCDNLTVAPWGDIIIAEDNEHPFIVGIRPDGTFYKIAENIGYPSEFAGVCFSETHHTLFVNIQHAGLTVAIDGPWIREI